MSSCHHNPITFKLFSQCALYGLLVLIYLGRPQLQFPPNNLPIKIWTITQGSHCLQFHLSTEISYYFISITQYLSYIVIVRHRFTVFSTQQEFLQLRLNLFTCKVPHICIQKKCLTGPTQRSTFYFTEWKPKWQKQTAATSTEVNTPNSCYLTSFRIPQASRNFHYLLSRNKKRERIGMGCLCVTHITEKKALNLRCWANQIPKTI